MKNQIQTKSIQYRKEKNENGISALNSLKTAITEAEKNNKNIELTDNEIYKIVNKLIKQREDSAESFLKVSNTEKANNEIEQKNILSEFLPKQLTDDEIKSICLEIMNSLGELPNINVKVGKTIGEFNKKYTGKADSKRVSEIVKNLV